MSYNESIIKFSYEYTNKVSPNNLNDEYLTKPIKRIIAFNGNYKKTNIQRVLCSL